MFMTVSGWSKVLNTNVSLYILTVSLPSGESAAMSPSTLPVLVRSPVVLCPMISMSSCIDIDGWLLPLLVAVRVGVEVAVGVVVGDGSTVEVGLAVGDGSEVGVVGGADVGGGDAVGVGEDVGVGEGEGVGVDVPDTLKLPVAACISL